MPIEIHEEKNCVWCEICGQFIYGKSVKEVRAVLDKLHEMII